jgi:hypothetical protein
MLARMAMIAITTSSSIKVKPNRGKPAFALAEKAGEQKKALSFLSAIGLNRGAVSVTDLGGQTDQKKRLVIIQSGVASQ